MKKTRGRGRRPHALIGDPLSSVPAYDVKTFDRQSGKVISQIEIWCYQRLRGTWEFNTRGRMSSCEGRAHEPAERRASRPTNRRGGSVRDWKDILKLTTA